MTRREVLKEKGRVFQESILTGDTDMSQGFAIAARPDERDVSKASVETRRDYRTSGDKNTVTSKEVSSHYAMIASRSVACSLMLLRGK